MIATARASMRTAARVRSCEAAIFTMVNANCGNLIYMATKQMMGQFDEWVQKTPKMERAAFFKTPIQVVAFIEVAALINKYEVQSQDGKTTRDMAEVELDSDAIDWFKAHRANSRNFTPLIKYWKLIANNQMEKEMIHIRIEEKWGDGNQNMTYAEDI